VFPTDPTGEISRQRIADLHAMAARQRLARSLTAHPANRTTTLRRRAAVVLLVAALIVVVVISGGRFLL
jgi:hypothetical protein